MKAFSVGGCNYFQDQEISVEILFVQVQQSTLEAIVSGFQVEFHNEKGLPPSHYQGEVNLPVRLSKKMWEKLCRLLPSNHREIN